MLGIEREERGQVVAVVLQEVGIASVVRAARSAMPAVA